MPHKKGNVYGAVWKSFPQDSYEPSGSLPVYGKTREKRIFGRSPEAQPRLTEKREAWDPAGVLSRTERHWRHVNPLIGRGLVVVKKASRPRPRVDSIGLKSDRFFSDDPQTSKGKRMIAETFDHALCRANFCVSGPLPYCGWYGLCPLAGRTLGTSSFLPRLCDKC